MGGLGCIGDPLLVVLAAFQADTQRRAQRVQFAPGRVCSKKRKPRSPCSRSPARASPSPPATNSHDGLHVARWPVPIACGKIVTRGPVCRPVRTPLRGAGFFRERGARQLGSTPGFGQRFLDRDVDHGAGFGAHSVVHAPAQCRRQAADEGRNCSPDLTDRASASVVPTCPGQPPAMPLGEELASDPLSRVRCLWARSCPKVRRRRNRGRRIEGGEDWLHRIGRSREITRGPSQTINRLRKCTGVEKPCFP